MRTNKSLKNIITSVTMGLIATIVGFITQKVFIESLGIEALGLNTLFTNIVTVLAVTELGLSSAIVYHLYKPLHEKNMEAVSSIMRFYKKSYTIIAVVVAVIGIILLPTIPLIVGESNIQENITLIYGLFVTNSVVSYLMSYRRSILYADQKSYQVNVVHIGTLIAMNLVQVAVLIITQNFYLFLIIKITATTLENIAINRIVEKKYSIDWDANPISKSLRDDIFKKIKGLIYHKIATFTVMGSTAVIISTMLGLTAAGLYSNYQLMTAALNSLSTQITSSLRASIGNLLVEASPEKILTTFNRLQFANLSVAILATSAFLVTSSSIISLVMGPEYTLGVPVVLSISINLYFFISRSVYASFKSAAGIFYEDRYVPIFEAIINILSSIVLVYIFGLAGAFMGAALSSLTLHAYSYPKYVYKGIFKKSYASYIKHTTSSIVLATIIIGTTYVASSFIDTSAQLTNTIAKFLSSLLIPSILLYLIYRKSEDFNYYKEMIKKHLNNVSR